MADTDDSGSVIVPSIGGAVAGVAGGTAASHLMNNESSVAKGLEKAEKRRVDAQNAYDAGETKVLGSLDPASQKLKQAADDAKTAHEGWLKQHTAAEQAAFTEASGGLNAAGQAKLEVDGLRGQLKYLEQQPEGFGRGYSIEATKKKITAIEELAKRDDFKSLPSDRVQDSIREGLEQAEDKLKAKYASNAADITAFEDLHKPKLDAARFQGIKEANPEIATKIAAETSATAEALKAAEGNLATAEGRWKPKFKQLMGGKGKDLAKAEAAVERMGALEAVNREKTFAGALKRPWSHLKSAGTGTKLAILGAGVALGALAYNHLKDRSSDREDVSSFTDRLEQQRLAATAAQSAGRGA